MFWLFFWMSELGVIDAWAQPMSATLPEGYVVHMPQPRAPEHLFGPEKLVPPDKSITGLEQHEKTCLTCGAVRITVIRKVGTPWQEWREWREKDAVNQSRWPIRCTGGPT